MSDYGGFAACRGTSHSLTARSLHSTTRQRRSVYESRAWFSLDISNFYDWENTLFDYIAIELRT